MQESIGKALAELLDRGFHANSNWHGELLPHVQDLSAEQALWRPAEGRNCIWENVRHITFCRRKVLNRVKGLPAPEAPDDGRSLPDTVDEAHWRADLKALRDAQQELHDWFKNCQAEDLLQKSEDGTYHQFSSRAGIISHDSYHTGQIAYIRALMGLAPVE